MDKEEPKPILAPAGSFQKEHGCKEIADTLFRSSSSAAQHSVPEEEQEAAMEGAEQDQDLQLLPVNAEEPFSNTASQISDDSIGEDLLVWLGTLGEEKDFFSHEHRRPAES